MTSLPPDGILLVTQPTHHAIDEGAARQSLQESVRMLPYRHLTAPVQVSMTDVARLSWSDARRSTEHFWRDEVLPLLREHPHWRVAYFGTAPSPSRCTWGTSSGARAAR
jgi:hypothetical protein